LYDLLSESKMALLVLCWTC